MARSLSVDSSFLEAALEGLELQKARIEEQIREVRQLLGAGSATKAAKPAKSAAVAAATAPAAAAPTRRKLSAAARKRIAAAQKKRWADFRKKTQGKEKAAPAKD